MALNCYSKHQQTDPVVTDLGRTFPTGFMGAKHQGNEQTGAQRQSPSPACAAVMPKKLRTMRCPSPAARQWLLQRHSENCRQQPLEGHGLTSMPRACLVASLLAHWFSSNGKCIKSPLCWVSRGIFQVRTPHVLLPPSLCSPEGTTLPAAAPGYSFGDVLYLPKLWPET